MPKILIIDDDILVSNTLKKFLIKNGYQVEVARNGQEGISKLLTTAYDIILCDIRLPGSDGIETIRDFKSKQKNGVNKNSAIIFMTGYASEQAPIEAIKLGAKDYLLKPFNLDEVLCAVRSCLQ